MSPKQTVQKEQYAKAIEKLRIVLHEKKTEVVRDSAIQRFEICADLAWKVLKTYLDEKHGVVCRSPKGCFREAFSLGVIDYSDFWLEIIDLRNLTVHTYNEKLAEEIFKKLPKALGYFEDLCTRLKPVPILTK